MDRESLILKYKKYAEKIANYYIFKKNIPSEIHDDIISISYIGLIDAIDTFQDDKGATLKTHIVNKIFHIIASELRGKYDIIGRITRLHINKLKEIEDEYVLNNRCKPSKEILCSLFNQKITNKTTKKKFKTNLAFEEAYRLINISHNDFDALCYELKSNDEIKYNCERKDLYSKIQLLIPSLNKKEQYCIKRYFFDEIPMSKIGIELNLTESRISQIIQESANKLKRWFNNDLVRNKMMNENSSIIELNDKYSNAGERKCKCGEILSPNRKVGVCPKCWGEQRHGKKKLKSKMESPQIKKSTNDNQILLDFSNDMGLLTNLKAISKTKRRTIENQILYMLDQILESQDNDKPI